MIDVLNGFQLQTGDHIYVRREDAIGFLIRDEQGDFNYNHVLCAFNQDIVATTGAKSAGLLGKVGIKDRFGLQIAKNYLANYSEICIKRPPALTEDEKTALKNVLYRMGGTPYDLGAVFKMANNRWKFQPYLGKKPLAIQTVTASTKVNDIQIEMPRMFCIQSVDFAFWKIGRKLGLEDGKLDPTAPTFRTLFDLPGYETVYEYKAK